MGETRNAAYRPDCNDVSVVYPRRGVTRIMQSIQRPGSREAVVYLTGMTQRELYGASYRPRLRALEDPPQATLISPNVLHNSFSA